MVGVSEIIGLDYNPSQEKSLAEVFRLNKQKMIERYEHQKEKIKHEEKAQKGTRTKEEILKLRKEMMKAQIHKPEPKKQEELDESEEANAAEQIRKGGKEPNPELLSRLASGKKTKVFLLEFFVIC